MDLPFSLIAYRKKLLRTSFRSSVLTDRPKNSEYLTHEVGEVYFGINVHAADFLVDPLAGL